MTQIPEEINYKEAYEREHLKSAELASRVAELEEKNDLFLVDKSFLLVIMTSYY